MSAVPSKSDFITLEEYFRLEAASEQRHDYVNGRMIPVGCDPATYNPAVDMAGGSPVHSQIVANLIRETGNQLKRKPCRVYDPNLRVSSPDGTRHYPDATIVCGPLAFDPKDKAGHTATNPTVIFEVLSPSTAGYDLGEKFEHYRSIDAFREYVVVRQDRAEVTTYFRNDEGTWAIRTFVGKAARAPIRSVNIELAAAEIYDGVEFPPGPPEQDAAAVAG